jgi:hypothetical protein
MRSNLFIWSMACAWLTTLTLAAPVRAQHGHPGGDDQAPDAAAWRADLATFAAEFRRVHPDPFAMCGEGRFDSALHALDERIPRLGPQAIATGFLQLSALIQDGHSGAIAMLPHFGFADFYPVRMTVEDGALYVVAAPAAHGAIVGGRVVTFGHVSAAEALARTLTVCSGDNEFSQIDRAPIFLMSPGVMRSLEITGDGPLRLVVEAPSTSGGRPARRTAEIAAIAPEAGRYPAFFQDPEGLPVAGGAALRDAAPGTPPLHLRDPDRAWWFKSIPDRNMVYLMLRRVDRQDDGTTFRAFIDSMFTYIDRTEAQYLVVDIRHNGGGDNTILQPLIHGLIRRDRTVNRPGHLYAITGRETFSAAMSCANWIEEHTEARFVGEPTGARPNHFGDATSVRLPNSGMPVRISQYRWSARLPWDDRPWIAPHLPAPPSVALTRANRDPALEAIFEEVRTGPLAKRLRVALVAGRVDDARGVYAAEKARRPDRWGRTTVGETAELAQTLFQEGHPEAALALARMNTDFYPGRADVWTTLGVGCVMAGRRDEARAALNKALEIDPGSESARRWLNRASAGE